MTQVNSHSSQTQVVRQTCSLNNGETLEQRPRDVAEQPNFIQESDELAVGALTRSLTQPHEDNWAMNLLLSKTKIVQVG